MHNCRAASVGGWQGKIYYRPCNSSCNGTRERAWSTSETLGIMDQLGESILYSGCISTYICMAVTTRYCNAKRTVPRFCCDGQEIQSSSRKMRMMRRQSCRATSRVLKSRNRAKERGGLDSCAQTCIFSSTNVRPIESDENTIMGMDLA